MLKLLKNRGLAIGTLLTATLAPGAATASAARPGTINYAEGQVTLNGRSIGPRDLRASEVAPGGILRTSRGKAEVLLTPGVFLRLDDNSALRMVSPSITDTRVELLRGEAMIEVAQLEKENRLVVLDRGVRTELDKKGLYRFDADTPAVAVYDGRAVVHVDDEEVKVGKGKELPLAQALVPGRELKAVKFDKNEEDDLYAWSKLRSRYLAEANQSSAESILASRPSWYYGTGWYWNPWYSTWAFVPGSGLLYSPFGFGYYSPSYFAYNPPFYHYGQRRVYTGVPRGHGGGQRVTRPAPAPTPRAAPQTPRTPPPAVGGSGVTFGR